MTASTVSGLTTAPTVHPEIFNWVEGVAGVATPDRVVRCHRLGVVTIGPGLGNPCRASELALLHAYRATPFRGLGVGRSGRSSDFGDLFGRRRPSTVPLATESL